MAPESDPVLARLDQALASSDGVTIDFDRPMDAVRFRMRAYARRRALHAKGNASYDPLVIRIVPPATVLIEHSRPIPAAEPLNPDFAADQEDDPIYRP